MELHELKESIKKAFFTKAECKNIEGRKVFVASDDIEDRDGEVIRQDGWDLNNFKQNPILLWSHDPEEPLIGKAENIRFRTIDGRKKLTFEPNFHKKSERSRLIADLVDSGYLNSVSVGFIPKELDGNIITKLELLEISFVNIPANPRAVSLAFAKKYSDKTIDELMSLKGIKTKEVKCIECKHKIKTVKANEDTRCPMCGNKMKEVKFKKKTKKIEMKSVIPFKSHSLADEGMSWDGPSQIKMCENIEQLKEICAWYDSSKPDVKSSYKLPHHLANGYDTVWRGVSAAMGALLGTRGGADIPDDERKGVYNHLSKHYQEFNKEVPEFKQYTEDELNTMFKTEEKSDGLKPNLKPKKSLSSKIKKLIEVNKELIDGIKRRDEIIVENNKKTKDEFDKIRLEIKAVSNGIKIDTGLENRFKNIEDNIQNLATDIREQFAGNRSEKGDNNAEGDQKSRPKADKLAIKAMNIALEVLNTNRKEN